MLPHVCYYSTGPLLYLYFQKIYHKKPSLSYSPHFIPALLVLFTYASLLINRLGGDLEIPWLWFSRNPWFIALHLSIYFILCLKLKLAQKSATQYDQLRAKWSKALLFLYGTFTLAYSSYYILVRFPFFNNEWDYAISIVMSFSIYTIGYFVIKEPQIFNGEFFSEVFLPKKQIASEEDVMEESLYEKLIRCMENEKPYTNNELRMVQLADQLGFSAHFLSKVINEKSGKNFNQFVNDYRLEEAQQLLLELPNEPIKTIYFEVGFNNKATFYNAFKEKYKCTPSQFRKTHISSQIHKTGV